MKLREDAHDRLWKDLAEPDPAKAGRSPDSRFGRIAFRKGYVSRDQIEECLEVQKRLEEAGEKAQLGQLLLKRGYLTTAQFLEVLSHQNRRLRVCLRCGRVYDISGHPDGVELRCLKCGEAMKPERSPEETRVPASAPAWAAEASRLGKYRILRKIARGGMASVFEAEDPVLQRHVALKILREEDVESEVVQRLQREAAIAAQLQHPNIVSIHEVGTVQDVTGRVTHYIAMDYVQGRTFADEIRHGDGRRRELVGMLLTVAQAVAYAHTKGIIHRDLKPGNILVEHGGRVLLTDFGLAHAPHFRTRLTHTRAVLGTPQYMAPEQVDARSRHVDERTDVYALGVMLYEILVGHVPFTADTPVRLYEQILRTEPERPSRLRRSVDLDLETIALKAMEKDPARRYTSAESFASDLRQWRSGEPIEARPVSTLRLLWRKGKKHRAVLLPAVAVLLCAAAAGAWLLLNSSRRAGDALASARRLESEGRIDAALELYRDVLRLAPGESEAAEGIRRMEAKLLLDRNRTRDREEANKQLELGRPSLLEAQRYRYERDPDPQELVRRIRKGMSYFEEAIRLVPDLAMAHYLLGMSRELAGDEEKAEAAYREALRHDANLGFARFRLGKLLLHRSLLAHVLSLQESHRLRHDDAERLADEGAIEVERAIASGSGYEEELQQEIAKILLAAARHDFDGAHARAHTGLSRFDRQEGIEELHLILAYTSSDLKEHRRHYDAALAFRPAFPVALYLRGAIARDHADLEGIRADMTQALRFQPGFVDALVFRSWTYEADKDFPSAESDLSEAIRLRPDFADAHYRRAVLRDRMGRIEEALQDYSEVTRIDPNHGNARYYSGVAFYKLGRQDEALSAFHESIRINPNHAPSLCDRGALRHKAGDPEGALQDYARAIESDASHLNAYHNRSILRIETGDLTGALDDCSAALRIQPDSAKSFYLRGNVLAALKRFREAIADYDEAIRLDPNLSDAHSNRDVARSRLRH